MEKVRIKRTNKQLQVTSWFKPNSNNKKTQRKRPKGKRKTSQPLVNYEVSWENTSTVTCSEHFTFATQLQMPDALRLKQSIVKMKSKAIQESTLRAHQSEQVFYLACAAGCPAQGQKCWPTWPCPGLRMTSVKKLSNKFLLYSMQISLETHILAELPIKAGNIRK